MKSCFINKIKVSNTENFSFIGGPCAIESLDHALFVCEKIKKICDKLKINYVYKSSFDKANRSSISGKRGIGIDEGLKILQKVKEEFDVPVVTDIHLPEQCGIVAQVVDVLQIPAFLCRQTDLLEAAAKTGKALHVKKGQFISPHDIFNIVKKLEYFGAKNIMLCERGSCFGYNNLVCDFRALSIMAKTGYPVIFDATHSVQLPSANGESSGGDRRFAPLLARAAISIGVAGIFMEVHEAPNNAPCDGPNMIYLNDLEQILLELKELDQVSKKYRREI